MNKFNYFKSNFVLILGILFLICSYNYFSQFSFNYGTSALYKLTFPKQFVNFHNKSLNLFMRNIPNSNSTKRKKIIMTTNKKTTFKTALNQSVKEIKGMEGYSSFDMSTEYSFFKALSFATCQGGVLNNTKEFMTLISVNLVPSETYKSGLNKCQQLMPDNSEKNKINSDINEIKNLLKSYESKTLSMENTISKNILTEKLKRLAGELLEAEKKQKKEKEIMIGNCINILDFYSKHNVTQLIEDTPKYLSNSQSNARYDFGIAFLTGVVGFGTVLAHFGFKKTPSRKTIKTTMPNETLTPVPININIGRYY